MFCGTGGASFGYYAMGCEVIGVDKKHQANYPFDFIKADAISYLEKYGIDFDFIHASPPCQAYSNLGIQASWFSYPKYIPELRTILLSLGLPYVIENVENAPLINPVLLCGTMFDSLRVIRHRLFETSFVVHQPEHLPKREHPRVHTLDKRRAQFNQTNELDDYVTVTGGANCSIEAANSAMGISWMTKREINEAIPPAYTAYIMKNFLVGYSD